MGLPIFREPSESPSLSRSKPEPCAHARSAIRRNLSSARGGPGHRSHRGRAIVAGRHGGAGGPRDLPGPFRVDEEDYQLPLQSAPPGPPNPARALYIADRPHPARDFSSSRIPWMSHLDVERIPTRTQSPSSLDGPANLSRPRHHFRRARLAPIDGVFSRIARRNLPREGVQFLERDPLNDLPPLRRMQHRSINERHPSFRSILDPANDHIDGLGDRDRSPSEEREPHPEHGADWERLLATMTPDASLPSDSFHSGATRSFTDFALPETQPPESGLRSTVYLGPTPPRSPAPPHPDPETETLDLPIWAQRARSRQPVDVDCDPSPFTTLELHAALQSLITRLTPVSLHSVDEISRLGQDLSRFAERYGEYTSLYGDDISPLADASSSMDRADRANELRLMLARMGRREETDGRFWGAVRNLGEFERERRALLSRMN